MPNAAPPSLALSGVTSLTLAVPSPAQPPLGEIHDQP